MFIISAYKFHVNAQSDIAQTLSQMKINWYQNKEIKVKKQYLGLFLPKRNEKGQVVRMVMNESKNTPEQLILVQSKNLLLLLICLMGSFNTIMLQ